MVKVQSEITEAELRKVGTKAKQESMHPDAESVMELPLDELVAFHDHPFSVVENMDMKDLIKSIKRSGVMHPIIVRQLEDSGYEIISGHRRVHACKEAGFKTIPGIVRKMDDDEAVIEMVDSNLQQRKNIPITERAKAYQMKLEAIKHQGQRNDLTSGQNVQKLDGMRSVDILAEGAPDSCKKIQRLICLNRLSTELKSMVDDGRLSFMPAVELSFVKPEEQCDLAFAIEKTQKSPSCDQARRIRQASENGKATKDVFLEILSEDKPPESDGIRINNRTLRKFFSKDLPISEIEKIIFGLLADYKKTMSKETKMKKVDEPS